MATAETLINTLQNITVDHSINKKEKTFLKDTLMQLQEKPEFTKIKNSIDLLSKGNLSQENKRELVYQRKVIIKFIKKYGEEFESMSNEDDFDENLTDNEIEIMLDAKVSIYNGFSKKHPMKGICYDEVRKDYRIKIENLNTHSKNLEAAIDKVKNNFGSQNNTRTLKKCTRKSFFYQNHYFVSYWHNNKPYFDIRHILLTLNLKLDWENKKYNEFSPKIVYNFWHKNKYDGYILRELVSEKIMYEIILSSNSSFSKSFKNDITDILIQLRENDQLNITKDKISLKNNILKKSTLNKFYLYSSLNDQLSIHKMISYGGSIKLTNYLELPVMYMFIVPLDLDHEHVIVKIGYSSDICTRIHSLKNEYKSNIYLLNLKYVKSEKTENNFHKMLHEIYPDNIENGVKGKVELYKLDSKIYEEFNNIKEESVKDLDLSPTQTQLRAIEYIRNQHQSFMEFLQVHLKLDNKSETYLQLHYAYLTMREMHFHEQIMKDKDIILKEKEIKKELVLKEKELVLKEKEVILREKDIEYLKLKHKYNHN